MAIYRGPLPSPATLRDFEQVLPGSAERIVAMAERQSVHRQGLEKTTVDANCKAQERGQQFALLITLAALISGVFLVSSGHSAVGVSVMLTSITALAGAFMFARSAQAKERADRRSGEARSIDGSEDVRVRGRQQVENR